MYLLFGKFCNLLFIVSSAFRVFAIKLLNPYVKIGSSCTVEEGVSFEPKRRGTVEIGDHTNLRRYCMITPLGGYIKIGSHCSVNAFTIIHGSGGVVIGNNVLIAPHCMIVSQNHVFENPNLTIREQGVVNGKIVICDDVWIGAGVKILAGVTISRGCVIAANSVVTKDTDPWGVYAGVPAKLIKSRK